MADQYSMFDLAMCGPTISAISSPGSAAGRTHSLLPGGTALSGPPLSPVSRSQSPARGARPPTSGICGPLFSRLSPSAGLQSCLESRLRAVMDVNGSPEFGLIWKEQAMPAGPPLCRLAPLGRRIDASGSSGSPWNTPTSDDVHMRTGRYAQGGAALSYQAASAWPTPKASDGEGGRTTKTEGGGNSHLPIIAKEAWSTPVARDRYTLAKVTRGAGSMAKGNQIIEPLAVQAAWATPTSRDHKDAQFCPNVPTNKLLGREVWDYGAWSTPRASDGEKGGPNMSFGAGGTPLPAQASGTTPNGGSAPMARRGALNPEFVSWLMGYNLAWIVYSPSRS